MAMNGYTKSLLLGLIKEHLQEPDPAARRRGLMRLLHAHKPKLPAPKTPRASSPKPRSVETPAPQPT